MAERGALAQSLGLDAAWRRAFARVEELLGGALIRAERHERWRPAWFLDVECGAEIEPVYFRGDRGAADHGIYPLEHEMRVLQILESQGIPVPHVHGFCEDPRGIVMQRCPGRANLASAESESERRAVLNHYMEILAQLHGLGPEAVADLGLHRPATPRELAFGDFPRWEKSFRRRKRRPEPLIEFAIGWLGRNIPQRRSRACLIAGDSGQFLFERGRVTALLDLELAHLGDPLADLAGMLCRDLSEPLGDLSRAFRRYGELTGETVDLDVVRYHAVRFGLCTPLAVAPLCAEPPPGLNLAQYMGWNLVYGRIALEMIAHAAGAALEAPELPEAGISRHATAHDALLQLLGGDAEPEQRSYEMDAALRVAQFVRELDRRGARLEEQDLDEAAQLLGRRPADFAEADRSLEELVRSADAGRDAELVRFFHRRCLRGEALLRPAMRELAGAALQQIQL